MTKLDFIKEAIKNGVQNDTDNLWVVVNQKFCSVLTSNVMEEETHPFEASEFLENDVTNIVWDDLYTQYLEGIC